jgi:hypothetical protein
MAVLTMSNRRNIVSRNGVKSLAFGMPVSGKSGNIRRRAPPTTETAYPICITWAARSPGVKYKIQGRRLSVGVSRTRSDSMGLRNGNRYGVVIELESTMNTSLRVDRIHSPVCDDVNGKRYEHHEYGIKQRPKNSSVWRIVQPMPRPKTPQGQQHDNDDNHRRKEGGHYVTMFRIS